ncbi:MAG: hypothetical protein QG622_3195, partial [Actinomycetota bacterium]|nr:hypothetical protein [Actinomycetota bacterium]
MGSLRRRAAGVVAAVMALAMVEAVPPAVADAGLSPSAAASSSTVAASGKMAVPPLDGGEAGDGLSRPDLVSAQKLAHTAKKRVEVLGERTESSATFVNADGTVSVRTFTGPRWVRGTRTVEGKQESSWADVDTTLVAKADGTVTPKAVGSGLVLSGGGDTGLVRMSKNGVGMATAAGVATSSGGSGVLPKPVLSGDTATYAEVQPGIDLTVTATRTGFETSWIVKARPSGPLSLELPVTLSGLTPATRADGGIDFANAAGATVMVTRTPLMWDAARDPVSGLPTRVTPMAMTLTEASTVPTP